MVGEGGKVAGAAKGGVEVEIEQLDGIEVVELEVENISDGEAVEAARVGGRMEG